MRLLVPAAAALLLTASCLSSRDGSKEAANPAGGAGAPASAADAKEEAKQKADDANFQVEMASARFERAKMDVEQQKFESSLATAKAKLELSLAQKALDHYVKVEMPAKRARAELELTQTKDYVTEQEEELAQLELMYKADDLGDKTKEIVLARSKRRLDRAQKSIALQTKDLDDLVSFQQPEQREKLENAVKDHAADLQRAEVAAKTGQVDKELALRTQEGEVKKQKREAEKAAKAASQP